MAYARTGVARVGTAPANYIPELRGFLPESPEDAFAICVSPARFAAYLAVQKKGSAPEFRPMRFRGQRRPGDPPHWKPDDQRDFWVPVHKLFPGECIRGRKIKKIAFGAHLVNEKLFRIEKLILGKRPPAAAPFVETEGLASFSSHKEDGSGTLHPEPHPLVAEAQLDNGAPATFVVPAGKKSFDTLNGKSPPPPHVPKDDPSEFRQSPEYVHIRTEVKNGALIDLNLLDDEALDKKLQAGGYKALHYADFTADGWVDAVIECPVLAKDQRVDVKAVAAYVLITAPDFFPSCDQRQLTVWTESNAVPRSIKDAIWNVDPDTLADQRLAPNIQIQRQL
jgi:hypothetical protein